VGRRNHVLNGVEISSQEGQFWSLSGLLKSIVSQRCGALRSKKINNDDSRTPDKTFSRLVKWSVSHYIVRMKNLPLRCGLLSIFFDHLYTSQTQFPLSVTEPMNTERNSL